LEAKASKVNDKKPLSFEELLANSVKQKEAETGMPLTEDEVAALEQKLRKLFASAQ
jgi:hypothetical protein